MLKIRILIFFITFLLFQIGAKGPYYTHTIVPEFKSLQVYNAQDIMSYPAIELNSQEQIEIRFDELSDSEQSLKYAIVHCNSDWLPSDLIDSEYINGFKSSFVDDYEYSINTNVPYVNYSLRIPNDLSSLKVSGNYAIIVSSENSGDPVLVACFYVYESRVNIRTDISYVTETDIRDENQQVNFSINHPGFAIQDPATELKLIIQQNNRRDNIKSGMQPTFINSDQIIYQNNNDLVFKGGNEFRYFEATSTRYNTHGIESIQYFNPYYHMVLSPDEPQSRLNYNYHQDVNGKFFVRKQEAFEEDYHTVADYVIVHFTIRKNEPYFDGKLFLNGAFTHNQFNEPYQMKYDFEEKAYHTSLLLKQGRYDYQYLFFNTGAQKGNYTPYENNFFQTENDYRIYCYYKSFNDRYERLIGYSLTTVNAK